MTALVHFLTIGLFSRLICSRLASKMFVWRTKAGEGLRKRLRQALADVGRLVENSDKTPVWLRPGSNSDKNAPIWGPDKIAQNPEFCGQASQLVAGGPTSSHHQSDYESYIASQWSHMTRGLKSRTRAVRTITLPLPRIMMDISRLLCSSSSSPQSQPLAKLLSIETTVENAKSPATIARPAVRRPKNLKLPLASALKADAPSAVSMGTIVSHALMSFEGDIRQARPVEEKGLGTVTQIP
ncbi:hypothetical protein R3P38DRAFT_2777279 [Favolaschia claudopus]|uniref:Uncharacterized protein n=1 Tax=Favolaschia claudopus TaxID=2862362 RepID=A0AAW0BK79_9AGAR